MVVVNVELFGHDKTPRSLGKLHQFVLQMSLHHNMPNLHKAKSLAQPKFEPGHLEDCTGVTGN